MKIKQSTWSLAKSRTEKKREWGSTSRKSLEFVNSLLERTREKVYQMPDPDNPETGRIIKMDKKFRRKELNFLRYH